VTCGRRPKQRPDDPKGSRETEQQIANLGRAFAALDQEPDKKPCPTIKALQVEGMQPA
jgi:ferritin-like metal-binding protein YciE